MLVAALSVLVAAPAAQAHYPYELVPAWFAEAIGPAAASSDCQPKEHFVGPHYDEPNGDTWSLSNFKNGEPVCRQVWGSAGEQVLCGIYLASIHYPAAPPEFPSGYERVDGSGRCSVGRPFIDDEGEPAFATQCSISLDVYDPAPDAWTPYDCRAEVLPGWPSSPHGEPLPLDPAKSATCKVRKCSYELTCSNPYGIGGCDASGLDIEAGASFGDIATGAPAIVANQRQAVELKTTILGRQLIKRALKNGKRKINGHAELYASQADAEAENDPLDEQRLKIRLKR